MPPDMIVLAEYAEPTAAVAGPDRVRLVWPRLGAAVSSWSALRSTSLLVVGGLAAGLAAKLADGTTWRWASDLGTFPAAWAFALVLIGHFSRSALLAGVRSATFSAGVVAAYYAWSAWVLDFGVGDYPVVWFVVGCTLAPAMAIFVWAGTHTRIPAWLVAAPTAALILAEGPLRQYWYVVSGGLPDGFGFHPVQAIIEVVLAAATIALLTRGTADRMKAVVLVIPLIWIAEMSLDLVWSTVSYQ